MDQKQIQMVFLFFFFSLLDEDLAIQSTQHTIQKLNKSKADINNQHIVSELIKQLNAVRSTNRLNRISKEQRDFIQMPSGVSLGAWQQYHRESSSEDMLAVLLCRVLRISEYDVAAGLNVSKGTITHRLSRGLRELGRLITLGESLA